METTLEELGTLFRSREGDEQVRAEAITSRVPLLHIPACRGRGRGEGGEGGGGRERGRGSVRCFMRYY